METKTERENETRYKERKRRNIPKNFCGNIEKDLNRAKHRRRENEEKK